MEREPENGGQHQDRPLLPPHRVMQVLVDVTVGVVILLVQILLIDAPVVVDVLAVTRVAQILIINLKEHGVTVDP